MKQDSYLLRSTHPGMNVHISPKCILQQQRNMEFHLHFGIASIERCRQAICMPIVCFDSTKQSDLEKVQDLNREITEYSLKQGWLNYRPDPYIHAPLTFSQAAMYWKYLRKIKEIFDPNMIMHPGRLALP